MSELSKHELRLIRIDSDALGEAKTEPISVR
jgi:hypothetical protein